MIALLCQGFLCCIREAIPKQTSSGRDRVVHPKVQRLGYVLEAAEMRVVQARSCGMIGGDGINDESNKTSPAPSVHLDLTEYTAAGCRCISIGEGLRAHAHELVVRGRGTCSLPLISGGQPSGPAIRPLAPTGGRMTDDAACVVWRAYGRPCAARARRRSGGRSRDSSSTVSAGTAG